MVAVAAAATTRTTTFDWVGARRERCREEEQEKCGSLKKEQRIIS